MKSERKLTCAVCGHVWRHRGTKTPRRCPFNGDVTQAACRSVLWKSGVRKNRRKTGRSKNPKYVDKVEDVWEL